MSFDVDRLITHLNAVLASRMTDNVSLSDEEVEVIIDALNIYKETYNIG